MSTTNLELEEINLNDTINETMLKKINGNMQKVDDKYGELKKALLEQTGKETLEEAIAYVQTLANYMEFLNSSGDAVNSDILFGKKAVVKGQLITGTILTQEAQTITPSTVNQIIESGKYLNGTQTIKGDANLVSSNILSGKSIFGITGNIVRQTEINVTLDSSSNSTYAGYVSGYGAGIDQNGTLVIWAMSNNANYENIDFIDKNVIGTIGVGWNITAHGTANSANTPRSCTITGLIGYNKINITLTPTGGNSTDDYVKIEVTITGS